MEFLNYSLIHNIKNCSSCGKNLNEIYKNKISKNTSELLKIDGLKKLDEDMLSYICEFNEQKHHNVIYPSNSHMLPRHLKRTHGHPNDIWWNEKRFCSDCFKNGIIRSLFIHEKRLPYKMWHIGYFTSKNEIKEKKDYLPILDRIFLPKFFYISFSRKEQPINKNNEQHITTN